MRGGLQFVPDAALAALTAAKTPYSVEVPATYRHEVAALRGDAAVAIQ
jgi:hypothetical protein